MTAPTPDRLATLTEREKDTLRLLVAGHDVKSVARHFGLSVHTVNERLRDARRKLGVSSSREAARMLAAAERADPDFSGNRQIGVAGHPPIVAEAAAAIPRRSLAPRLAWISGGLFVMSLLIAALVATGVVGGSGAAPAAQTVATATEGSAAALNWLALVDRRDWTGSWRAASTLFRTQVTAEKWTAMVEPVRQPLGAVETRALVTVTKTDTLPGAPAGAYEVVQFRTDFTTQRGATETVIMMRDGGAWRVAGYFVRPA